MQCSNCGVSLEAGASFCVECGVQTPDPSHVGGTETSLLELGVMAVGEFAVGWLWRLVSWAVWGVIALLGLRLVADNRPLAWVGASILVFALGGLFGFFSLLSVFRVLRKQIPAAEVRPESWLRALVTAGSWLIALGLLVWGAVG